MSGGIESFLAGRVTLHAGNCLDVLKSLDDASIDSVVTDPPYALTSIARRYAGPSAVKTRSPAHARLTKGFMGKAWDTGDVAFAVEFWAEVYRVLKPGGHVLAFGGTRTVHRLTCAIEDAGFEIRDMVAWLYGSGFPKSHDVAKGIDKAAGAARTKVRVGSASVRNPKATGAGRDGMQGATRPWIEAALKAGFHETDSAEPVTPEAAAWDGWGTALKPALEPITVGRKPLAGTVAENVLAHGTGALNIAGCRVEAPGGVPVFENGGRDSVNAYGDGLGGGVYTGEISFKGRWPANLIHDGSDDVVAAFPRSESPQPRLTKRSPDGDGRNGYGAFKGQAAVVTGHGDSGSASRFFYSAKADADDRIGSKHPTVKPVDLMRYLVRLVTPPGGTVLDPFAGTGTTGEAAYLEGFSAVLVERESEYREDIARRMALTLAGPTTRRTASRNARQTTTAPLGGMFEGLADVTDGDAEGEPLNAGNQENLEAAE